MSPDATKLLDFLLQGHGQRHIESALEAELPGFDVSPLMAEVFSYLQSLATQPPLALLGWCLENARDLYRRSVEIGDFANALRAINLLIRLASYLPETPLMVPEEEPLQAAARSLRLIKKA